MPFPAIPPAFWDCRRLIKQAQLPAAQKHLLSVLHEFAGEDRWCFPHQSTLAAACGWSVRQVQRHLAALVAAGLLDRKRRQTGNLYAIAWDALADIAVVDRGRCAVSADSVVTPAPVVATTPVVEAASTRSSAARDASPVFLSPTPVSGPTRPPRRVGRDTDVAWDTTSVSSRTSIQPPTERPKNIPRADVVSTNGVTWDAGGVRPGEFASLDHGERRFAEAVSRWQCQPDDRRRFLTLWAYIARRSQPGVDGDPIRNPGGFLTRCLAHHDWAGGSVDEDRVHRWETDRRRMSDRRSLPPRNTSPPPSPRTNPTIADPSDIAAPTPLPDLLAEFKRRRGLAIAAKRDSGR